MNPRSTASRILHDVLDHGINLDTALTTHLPAQARNEQAFVQALCYGVLRDWPQQQLQLQRLLHKPLHAGSELVHALLLCGLHELYRMRTAPYAAVSQTVAATQELGVAWARGLVNAVLRNAQRRQAELAQQLAQQPEAVYAHPHWLLSQLQQDWPDQWQAIVAANNRQAPLVLRVNLRRISRDAYIYKLAQAGLPATATPHSATGIVLASPCDIEQLPGFSAGEVSVQDTAAQLVTVLLDPQPHERILDACAAPGGKTLHILEQQPQLAELVALDSVAQRLMRVRENLQRAALSASVVCGDASQPAGWWDKTEFDRILLDAPCSATGVIRRHPDIKVLRQLNDIARLGGQQQQMLQALWPLLKPGGMLLYTTCSVLVQENDAQLDVFLKQHATARVEPIPATWGHATVHGRQILPGEDDMDGFYYACLRKAV
jgi:16S rRNA (cytosine967-C5)-methyltransferase